MTSIVDIARIQETSDGDHEFEVELIEMYIEDAQMHLDILVEALVKSNFAQIKTTSHTLKGSSANIGATGVQQYALEMELAANQEDLAGANDLMERLNLVFLETETFYKTYIETLE